MTVVSHGCRGQPLLLAQATQGTGLGVEHPGTRTSAYMGCRSTVLTRLLLFGVFCCLKTIVLVLNKIAKFERYLNPTQYLQRLFFTSFWTFTFHLYDLKLVLCFGLYLHSLFFAKI